MAKQRARYDVVKYDVVKRLNNVMSLLLVSSIYGSAAAEKEFQSALSHMNKVRYNLEKLLAREGYKYLPEGDSDADDPYKMWENMGADLTRLARMMNILGDWYPPE